MRCVDKLFFLLLFCLLSVWFADLSLCTHRSGGKGLSSSAAGPKGDGVYHCWQGRWVTDAYVRGEAKTHQKLQSGAIFGRLHCHWIIGPKYAEWMIPSGSSEWSYALGSGVEGRNKSSHVAATSAKSSRLSPWIYVSLWATEVDYLFSLEHPSTADGYVYHDSPDSSWEDFNIIFKK